jgi:hypothetical protein
VTPVHHQYKSTIVNNYLNEPFYSRGKTQNLLVTWIKVPGKSLNRFFSAIVTSVDLTNSA